jgi:hypothetical protein
VLPFILLGDRPWLGGRAASEPCDQRLKLLVRTASDAYFAQVVSALRLPRARSRSAHPADPREGRLEGPPARHLPRAARRRSPLLPWVASAIEGSPRDAVLAVIEAERSAEGDRVERPLRNRRVRAPDPRPRRAAPACSPPRGSLRRLPRSRRTAPTPAGVSRLVVVPSCARSASRSLQPLRRPQRQPPGRVRLHRYKVRPPVLTLPTGNEKWLPAAEVRGEGIFFELDLDACRRWETSAPSCERARQMLHAGLRRGRPTATSPASASTSSTPSRTSCSPRSASSVATRPARSASASTARPGPRRTRRAWPASSCCTGTTGSEGTLGGLVEEGRRLRHHLREAWDLGRLCSNDPCAPPTTRAPRPSDRRLEGAACHGCLYVAECSCERFNRFLDRALVVPTIGNDPALAFFVTRSLGTRSARRSPARACSRSASSISSMRCPVR